MEGFIILFFGVIVFLGVMYSRYISAEYSKERWREFSKTHGLTFVSGGIFGPGSYVTGNYRGHNVMLESFQTGGGERSKIGTRVLMQIDRTHQNEANVPILEQYTPETLPRDQSDIVQHKINPGQMLERITQTDPLLNATANLEITTKGFSLEYRQDDLLTGPARLTQLFNFLSDILTNYPSIVALGGEAVDALQVIAVNRSEILRPVAQQLLNDISSDTTRRIKGKEHQTYCPSCWASCEAHTVTLSWYNKLIYYGCRKCGQSRTLLCGQIIAVLDENFSERYVDKDGIIMVDWLTHRKMFDFDTVYIGQTTDEQVERFAVQAGNDTDAKRKARHRSITCLVSPNSNVTENSLRILRRMFGTVQVRKLPTAEGHQDNNTVKSQRELYDVSVVDTDKIALENQS